MSASPLSSEEMVDAVGALMRKHGLSYARVGDVELRRPDGLILAEMAEKLVDEKAKEATAQMDDLAVLQNMSPEQQDRALMLEPLVPRQ